jgi:hypothetical protein
MTEMSAHTTSQQPPVHVFYNGVLLDTSPAYDDWLVIEEDMARVTWEALLLFSPNEAVSLTETFARW